MMACGTRFQVESGSANGGVRIYACNMAKGHRGEHDYDISKVAGGASAPEPGRAPPAKMPFHVKECNRHLGGDCNLGCFDRPAPEGPTVKSDGMTSGDFRKWLATKLPAAPAEAQPEAAPPDLCTGHEPPIPWPQHVEAPPPEVRSTPIGKGEGIAELESMLEQVGAENQRMSAAMVCTYHFQDKGEGGEPCGGCLTCVQAKLAEYEKALRDLAERDCTYGDNCPPFGTRHGACVGCIARAALAAPQGEEEKP